MPSTLCSRLVPQCTACARRIAFGPLDRLATPSLTHVRRKSKKASDLSDTITVRLRQDVPKFGRRGSIVPVPAGMMRNLWFPRSVAEYVTQPELKEMRARQIYPSRDFDFGIAVPEKSEDVAELDPAMNLRQKSEAQARQRDAARLAEAERVTPERSMELIEIFVPKRLDFYRQVIEPAAEPEKQEEKSKRMRSISGAASDLLAARATPVKSATEPQAIFGSVTSADVATAMKAVLAENEEAAKIKFGENEVRFVDAKSATGTDRVKNIGEYQVEVRIKGHDAVLTRTVRVLAQAQEN